ncbi:MAG: FtsQ-type POTRA domain-containing protein [Nitrospirae bacterium]|nr:FtsQ-type POTRA domain-containing protein [Nitrospirota bacterium]
MGTRNIRTLQRRKEKKQFLYKLVPPLAAVALCLVALFLIKHLLLVREIVFTGNRHLKNDELGATLGARKNSELFGVSGRDLYLKLRKSPWIKDAIVRRELSGRVIVKVTERVPVALLMLEDRPYLIDNEGYLLEQMKEGTILLLPVIKGIDPVRDKATYAEAVKFVGVLHDRRVVSYQGDVEISGQRPEDITLKVDNIIIKVGMDDFEKKLERLEFVRDEIHKRNMTVEYIDLRFANKIVVRPAHQEAQVDETLEVVNDNGKKKKD